ncbi:hypothetical protein MGH68_08630 [Erysipelothrix sp. D19-032]
MNKFASMVEMKLFGELMDTEIAIESIVLTEDKTELNINDTQVINAALTPLMRQKHSHGHQVMRQSQVS